MWSAVRLVDFEGDDCLVITQLDLVKINADDLLAVYSLADLIDLIIN